MISRLQHLRLSFRIRIFIAFTILTALIAAAFMAIALTNEVKSYQERSAEKARLLASMLADAVRLPLFSGDLATLDKIAHEMLATTNIASINIMDLDGKVLVDIAPKQLSQKTSQGNIASASVAVMTSTSFPTVDMALSGTTASNPSSLGTVRVSIDTSELRASLRTTSVKTGGVVLAFWFLVLVVTYPVLKRITRSFEALAHGLDRMVKGDFNFRIPIESNDDASQAIQAVNRLAAALEERETENRILQQELLHSMHLEMQEEKRMMMAKLIQTNRMTSLGLLISSMAHNINTPNAAIKLAGQYIHRSYKDLIPVLEGVAKEEGDFLIGGLRFSDARGELLSAAESVCHNAERVERVIQDLRTYNVGERSEYAPGVSVNQAVEGALTIVRAHGSQSQVAMAHQLAPGLPDITGNKHQLEQVIVNLLLNAMQASTGDSGPVRVTTRYQEDLREVQIIVADEGPGLPDVVAQNLFEPFISTRIDKGGSGLGLYISNFIVSEHKGRIVFGPNTPAGTIVTVHLPV